MVKVEALRKWVRKEGGLLESGVLNFGTIWEHKKSVAEGSDVVFGDGGVWLCVDGTRCELVVLALGLTD